MDEQNRRSSVEQQKVEVMRNLLALMIDNAETPDRREAAKHSLRRIGDVSIVGSLAQVIEESNSEAAVSDATEILGFLPATANIRTSLIRLLWHESPDVRRAAMQSLARIGNKEVASVLAVIISDSKDPATIFDVTDGNFAKQVRSRILRRSLN